ncbi:MAG: hypothetical protein H7Z19_04990 [Chitinophagaceae bacterium]|nr:hypothetical protein [Rubrivivax sp.]
MLLARLAAQQAAISAKDEHIARRDSEIKFKNAKIERITLELARLKAWKFGARTEAISAEQRQLFEDTLAEDEADLQAQLDALQTEADQPDTPKADSRKAPSSPPEAARAPSACGAPPRAREHHLPHAGLRAGHGARGRRRQ